MLRVGHYGAAMVAYAPVVSLLLEAGYPGLAGFGLPIVFATARLPDLDRRLPFLPHRGPTHTVWFAVLIGSPVALGNLSSTGRLWVDVPGAFGIGVPMLGVLSHVAADTLTPAGTRPFWPLSARTVSASLVRASNPIANSGLFAAGVLCLCLAVWKSGVVPPVPA